MGTESRNPRSIGLDKMSAREIARLMNEEEMAVNRAVAAEEANIALAGEQAALAYQRGGRVVYVGAGTSGRVAMMDAAEMPPTFGVQPGRFVALVAGGPEAVLAAVEDAEDDEHAAIEDLNAIGLNRDDIVIGLAASGKTPYVVSAVRHAHQKGIWTCGVANNKRNPLFAVSNLAIYLNTGPEVLTGSTRLKAATAQKLVLNQVSTIAMVLSGKVIENLMVDVKATNHKLRERSVRILRDLTTVSETEAERLLSAHSWNVRHVLTILRASPVADE
jgi:N-acetylmuramic acid 6-phosphate etherase